MAAPLCGCHDEPMLWQTEKRWRKPGSWRCAVKNREEGCRAYERRMQDPVWRNERRLKQARQHRAVSRAKQVTTTSPGMAELLIAVRKGVEGSGQVSSEGRG